MEKLKEDVQRKFNEIRNVLYMREKLLLRQADVILQQMGRVGVTIDTAVATTTTATNNSSSTTPAVEFLAEQEDDLLAAIRNFGRFHLENINLPQEEDYISPQLDHEIMYKNIISKQKQASQMQQQQQSTSNEAISAEFSHNKSLIEHNAQNMNESIVSITLQEAKELIRKARLKRDAAPIPPLNLEELDDELESSIAEAVSSLGHEPSSNNDENEYVEEEEATAKEQQQKKFSSSRGFKPKITINNCNGTINLRNISNLTINCANEDAITARIPCHQRKKSQQNTLGSENEIVSTSGTAAQSVDEVQVEQEQQQQHNQEPGADNLIDENSTATSTTASGTEESNNSSNFSSRSHSTRSQNQAGAAVQPEKLTTVTTAAASSSTSVVYPYGLIDYDECDESTMSQHAVSCDFYNRLLNEIKKSLRHKQPRSFGGGGGNTANATGASNMRKIDLNSNMSTSLYSTTTQGSDKNATGMGMDTGTGSNTTTANTANNGGAQRRLVLKNFENLRIVLEANSSDEESADPKFHPVQIEQWLAEIISETDLEPMQNSDILEHSKIHTE